MTLYETWEIPQWDHRPPSDLEDEFKFLTDSVVVPGWPRPRKRWSSEWWVGEIKPHTQRGIAAGRAQLSRHPNKPPLMSHRLLVTYRPAGRSAVEVLVSPAAGNLKTWHRLATAPFKWKQPVPLDSCPACLGAAIEQVVRSVVRSQVPTIVTKASPFSRGYDLSTREIEELEFLRELVTELAAG